MVVLGTLMLGMLVLDARTAQAQYVDDVLSRIGISDEISVGGSVGFVSEFYGASGISSRRPGASGRMYAQAQGSGYGLSYGLNLLLTTEQFQFDQNARRQSINQIDFGITYKWIKADIGRVSPQISQYSFNGATVNGGFLELTPGNWRFTYAGGVSQRAVEPAPLASTPAESPTDVADPTTVLSPRAGTYKQWIHTGRVGYGQDGGTFLELVGVYGFDQGSSLQDPGALTPTSNTNLTTKGGFNMLRGRLRLQGQITASGFTPDREASRSNDSPGLFYDVGALDARLGSRMGYAGRISSLLNVKYGQLRAYYERIQPEFKSVGTPNLRTDQEVIRVEPRTELIDGKVRLSAQLSQRRNNLNDDLQSTLRRRQGRLNAQMRLTQRLNVTAALMRLVNENVAAVGAPTTSEFRQISDMVSLSPVFTFRTGATTHSTTMTAMLQRLNDQRELAGAAPAGYKNYSGSLSYTLGLASGMSFGLSGNALLSEQSTSDLLTTSLTANASHSFLDRALRLNVSSGWSRNQATTNPIPIPDQPLGMRMESVSEQVNVTSSLVYRLDALGQLSVRVRGLRSSRTAGEAFTEVQSTFRYEYRF